MRRVAILAALVAGCATAPLRNDGSVCPEYRSLRCASAPECSFDKQRGCFVCQCQKVGADREDAAVPSGVSPDRR